MIVLIVDISADVSLPYGSLYIILIPIIHTEETRIKQRKLPNRTTCNDEQTITGRLR